MCQGVPKKKMVVESKDPVYVLQYLELSRVEIICYYNIFQIYCDCKRNN